MSSEPAENSSLHSLITGIFNALSHEIRSPLSVISNETSCFEASIGTDAIKKSVKEIVDIIDLANAYQNEEDVSFTSVQELRDALGNGVTLAPNLPLNSPLNLKEKKSLIYALQQTLKQISSPSRTTISIESNHLALRVSLERNPKESVVVSVATVFVESKHLTSYTNAR